MIYNRTNSLLNFSGIIFFILCTGFQLAKNGAEFTLNNGPAPAKEIKAIRMDKKNVIIKEKEMGGVIKILKRWDLPEVLREISGIGYIDATHFACIQDEIGIIYIYNIETAKIETEIPFAGPGDFEGITLVGNEAYVVRADGKLYAISDISGEQHVIKEYSTPLTAKHDVEGLCYDKNNNRLLLAAKETKPGLNGIYAFDLASKTLKEKPVLIIELPQILQGAGQKKKPQDIMTSAINIHPITNDIYLTDGRKSQLLILDKEGKIKNFFELNPRDFSQPEGISFNPAGEMFISNEGVKDAGNILKVSIN
jgi:uncharacterized protein YjiK